MENGGSVVQNPVMTTKYVIAEKMDFKFRTLAISNPQKYIFIRPIYIDACIA